MTENSINSEGYQLIIPINKWLFYSIVAIVIAALGACLMALIIVNRMIDKPDNTAKVISSMLQTPQIQTGVYDVNKIESVKLDSSIRNIEIEFWTPSKETKFDLVKSNKFKNITEEKNDTIYYVDDKETQINLFERELEKTYSDGIRGWNRVLAVGKGNLPSKRGYLWSITFTAAAYDKKKFLELYSNFWKRKNGIYMKETFYQDELNRKIN